MIAQGTVECFSIKREIFNKAMGSMKDRMNTYILSRTLEHVPITSGLTAEENALLCNKFQLERYEDGEYVVKQGTEGDSFFIIFDGKVKVTQDLKEGTVVIKEE